ncbi:MAG: lysophospholipid acyltransferase family protein [Candidatus Baltobacteraceae bacterium]
MKSDLRPLAGLIAGIARIVSGVQVTWDDVRPEARQSVFFANHTSHLDFVVLWSSLPPEVRALTRPVAAEDYWSKGMRRDVAVGIFNAVLVPRHHVGGGSDVQAGTAIDRLADAMGERFSLIMFPEGTRGTGEEVAPFKSGLYYLCARKPALQLVPAYLENLNRILPKGEFLPVPFISKLSFGAPTFLQPSEPKQAFLDRMRDAVCELRSR